jgi:hypothetical protein
MPSFIILIMFSGFAFDLVPGGRMIQTIILGTVFVSSIMLYGVNQVPRDSVTIIALFFIYIIYEFIFSLHATSSLVSSLIIINKYILGLLILIWSIVNRGFSTDQNKWRDIVIIVLIVQVIFGVIKFKFSGFSEGFMIGSMSKGSGQLAFLIPAIFIPILVCLYYTSNKRSKAIITFLIISMFLFGVSNNKRATFYVLPFLLVLSIIYLPKGRIKITIPIFLVSTISVLCTLYIAAKFSPHLLSTKVGLSYLIHLKEFAVEYAFMDYGDNTSGTYFQAMYDKNVQVGRISILYKIIEFSTQSGIKTFLFGIGPGMATPNMWIGNDRDILFSIIGARGAISGIGLTLLESGLIGVTILTYFIFFNVKYIYKTSKVIIDPLNKMWARVILLVHIVFCFDFFFYSTTLFFLNPLPLFYFGSLGLIVKLRYSDNIQRRMYEKIRLKSSV